MIRVLAILSIAVSLSACGGSDPKPVPLQPACKNPISMSLQKGEQAIELSDVINGEEGSYQAVETKFHMAISHKGEARKGYLTGSGFEYIEPSQAGEKTSTENSAVACHNARNSQSVDTVEGVDENGQPKTETTTVTNSDRLSGDLDVPNAISTKDGQVTHYRRDEFLVENGASTSRTVIYPRSEKLDPNVKDQIPDNMEIQAVRVDEETVKLKIKGDLKDENSNTVLYIETTYKLKK